MGGEEGGSLRLSGLLTPAGGRAWPPPRPLYQRSGCASGGLGGGGVNEGALICGRGAPDNFFTPQSLAAQLRLSPGRGPSPPLNATHGPASPPIGRRRPAPGRPLVGGAVTSPRRGRTPLPDHPCAGPSRPRPPSDPAGARREGGGGRARGALPHAAPRSPPGVCRPTQRRAAVGGVGGRKCGFWGKKR